jgi:lipopolysaccharide export system protein LptA
MLFVLPPHLIRLRQIGLTTLSAVTVAGVTIAPTASPEANAQVTDSSQALTLRSDVQEANSVTGVITARGNVQINYPARQIQATSVQAQYYSREQRIVLTGDVYVLQNGNSLRGEVITYLIDEGRFVALPDTGQQVESIYLVEDSNASPTTAGTTNTQVQDPFDPKPEFKDPISE